jgi:hypothetical protein
MPPTKTVTPTFDEVLHRLGSQSFDVAPPSEDAKRIGGPRTVRVCKYNCAAEIAPANGSTEIISRPGCLLDGQISSLLDRGYQKFLKTTRLEIPATAAHLQAIHRFHAELNQVIGATSLYNESLGTTSDTYLYDRLTGRP